MSTPEILGKPIVGAEYAPLPPEVNEAARVVILDGTGEMLAGSEPPHLGEFVDLLAEAG